MKTILKSKNTESQRSMIVKQRKQWGQNEPFRSPVCVRRIKVFVKGEGQYSGEGYLSSIAKDKSIVSVRFTCGAVWFDRNLVTAI